MLNKGLNISYGDDVNYYYIYRTLKTSFLQMYNKKKKEAKVCLDDVTALTSSQDINFDEANNLVLDELDELFWYDRKVYNLIQYDYSITELSKKTTISYHSLYNTYRKVKKRLSNKLMQ